MCENNLMYAQFNLSNRMFDIAVRQMKKMRRQYMNSWLAKLVFEKCMRRFEYEYLCLRVQYPQIDPALSQRVAWNRFIEVYTECVVDKDMNDRLEEFKVTYARMTQAA